LYLSEPRAVSGNALGTLDFRCWHETEVPTDAENVRFSQTGSDR
jgi:hypothetical protein